MNYHQTHHLLKLLLNPHTSASLITDEGKLLASSDQSALQSSTSRLVVFQIMKKYLNPQVNDLFILNDPENGGLNFQNIFFATRLTEKIYLVFVKETEFIHFKIPPTPLFEKGSHNKTIWPFLVDQSPHAKDLAEFFEIQFNSVKKLNIFADILQYISVLKNQQTYFKVIEQLFARQFNNRALGQNEILFTLSATEFIKLKLAIDEKQNQRTIYADFSQSSAAQKISAASHITESCLVKAIADHYGMSEMLCQPLLDRIRLSLPPQSIVTKAHSQGTYNLLIQKIVSEQVAFLLSTLNGQTKTKSSIFKLAPEFKLQLKVGSKSYGICGTTKMFSFPDLDYLIQSRQLLPITAQNAENKVKLKFQIKTNESVRLSPTLVLNDAPSDFLSVAEEPVLLNSEIVLSPEQTFEINWKLT